MGAPELSAAATVTDARPAGIPAGPRRRPEIDLVKGVCIIGVVLIHSRPLVGTVFYDYVVNRAVPVFLVLFGLTSELWWRAREGGGSPLRTWYGARLRRLMIPLWGALTLWWVAIALSGVTAPIVVRLVVETYLGYLLPLGTGWFVTLILQLIVVFPGLRWAVDRAGVLPVLVSCALITVVSHVYSAQAIQLMRTVLLDRSSHSNIFDLYYFFWIFAPAYLVLVAGGIALARHPVLLGARPATIAALAFVAGAAMVEALVAKTPLEPALLSLLDLPLTIVLLGAAASLDARRRWARIIAWWGTASWGMYLGQMILHEWLFRLRIVPQNGPLAGRWAYGAFLLVGATALVIVGERVRLAGMRVLSAPRDS